MRSDDPDVLVVGAGLAGLRCAGLLTAQGHRVEVLEAGADVGGRVRTEVIDGHRCDVGFQLLNPAYPAVPAAVDVPALDLRPFAAGVAVRRAHGVQVLADPRRAPGLLPATLRASLPGGLVRPVELARLAAWTAPALGPVDRLTSRRDRSLADSLDAAAVHGPLRREVLEPFLAGVLADDTGSTSAAFVRLLLRSFLRGTPAVPALGMQELPRQLARRLTAPVRCRTRVRAIRRSGSGITVDTDADTQDRTTTARAVVLATDAAALADLGLPDSSPSGRPAGDVPTVRGLRTWWFSLAESDAGPLAGDTLLRVDGRRGPVLNTAVLSAAAPTYAPPGRVLVQATTLSPSDCDEARVRAELARLWGCPTRAWQLVTCHDVPRALPTQAPPLTTRRPVALGGGLFVAGDHRDTASIQGALVSGRRAADAVHAFLGHGRERG